MKRGHARGLLAIGGGIGLTIAMFGAVAWACVPTARITLDPTNGGVGTNVTVSGSSFAADATAVKVWWGAAGGSRMELASTTVAADRTIKVSFAVPDVPGGNHIVSVTQYRADGGTIGNPSNATFRVNAPGTTAAAPNLQGSVQDADGAAGLQAAPAESATPAPAPATQTAAAPAPARQTTRAATAAPARAAQTATAPAAQTAPAAATETAAAPAAAAPAVETPAPAPAPAAETPARTFEPAPATPAQGTAAEKPSRSDTPVGTLVLLALLSLAFIGTGTAIFLNERKRVRARA